MKLKQKHGMILLLILMLSSSLSAFMNTRTATKQTQIIIKFNNYEVYGYNTSADTILKAISNQYPVRINNNTLCIRYECDNNNSKWLIISQEGFIKNINSTINSEKYYVIYNTTETTPLINFSQVIK